MSTLQYELNHISIEISVLPFLPLPQVKSKERNTFQIYAAATHILAAKITTTAKHALWFSFLFPPRLMHHMWKVFCASEKYDSGSIVIEGQTEQL